ncbi:hypothetical protein [Mycobacterium sp. E2497]|uniref:hypothetical protein n=1 Tax=Mycobacterium sp. E2497 TaxID=1834135 RepID=UPI0012EAD346|nr:hypothetical protein [Mycobacterium sp. E2497]
MKSEAMNSEAFAAALISATRSPDLPKDDDLFDFIIGDWELAARVYDDDGNVKASRGELLSSWILEGRAIQDLFIFPPRVDRRSTRPSRGDRYGTTIRVYDNEDRTWRVYWLNPADEKTSGELRARPDGVGIVLTGTLWDGAEVRWYYREITATSFRYSAEKLTPNRRWQRYLELDGLRQRDGHATGHSPSQ